MIGPKEVTDALTFEMLIEPVAEAFRASSAAKAQNGLIVMFPLSDHKAGDVYVKSAVIEDRPFYIVKVAPWFAVNAAEGQSQGGFIGVFDSGTGHTIAVIEDRHRLSDLRTAAAGALAARVFAPQDVQTASVLGSGVQAYWQVMALHHERRFKKLKVWARNAAKAEALAVRLRASLPSVSVEVQNRETAIREADVILTTTGARDPLVPGAWIRPGQHITAVGADDATKCELDVEVLTKARVFVDEVDTAVATGDIHRAVSGKHYTADQIEGEIGSVLANRLPGRRNANEITVATFSGIGAQDLAAVEVLMELLKR
jgi:ornithine cyclodeaminase